jgi:hypothetical protein
MNLTGKGGIDIEALVKASFERYDAMSPQEKAVHDKAQRESWVRGMSTPCEHGMLDFEQCGPCRATFGTVTGRRVSRGPDPQYILPKKKDD